MNDQTSRNHNFLKTQLITVNFASVGRVFVLRVSLTGVNSEFNQSNKNEKV